MELHEFERRRSVLDDAQSLIPPGHRALVGRPELRSAPTEEPGGGTFSITPTHEGTWRAEEWYSEVGGVQCIAQVVAPTRSAALDWVWWAATRRFREKHVVPSHEQPDIKRRETLRQIPGYTPRGRLRTSAESPWEDDSTDAARLGRAGMAVLDSATTSAVRIARNPCTPPEVLARLAAHPALAVRWQVAGNPQTPAATLAVLSHSDDVGVRWYLAARPETATSDLVDWVRDDPALWSAVLARVDVPAEELERLLVASSGGLRFAIARHDAAPPALVSTLAAQSDALLGVALLRHGRCSADDVDVIAGRSADWPLSSLTVALTTAEVPLDPSAARRFARSDVPQQRAIAAATGTRLGQEDLEALTRDDCETVRIVLAATTGAENVARLLAADPSAWVRNQLAQSTTTPPDVIGDLTRDRMTFVQWSASRNPRVPTSALQALVGGPDLELSRDASRVIARRQRQAEHLGNDLG